MVITYAQAKRWFREPEIGPEGQEKWESVKTIIDLLAREICNSLPDGREKLHALEELETLQFWVKKSLSSK